MFEKLVPQFDKELTPDELQRDRLSGMQEGAHEVSEAHLARATEREKDRDPERLAEAPDVTQAIEGLKKETGEKLPLSSVQDIQESMDRGVVAIKKLEKQFDGTEKLSYFDTIEDIGDVTDGNK
jgi:hypothetical protein